MEIITTGKFIVGQKIKKKDDMDNLFVGANFCVEVYEIHNKEEIEEQLGDSGGSSHTDRIQKSLKKSVFLINWLDLVDY